MLRAPCQQLATARIQRRLIIIQQQRAPFTHDRHFRERVICARANEGITVSLSRMGTSRCHFRVRRHRDVTFARAETSQCHFCKKLREYIANFFLHPTVTAEGVGLKIVYLLYCDCATFNLRSRYVVQLQ